MFDAAQFPQRLDSCAEYLRTDGQAVFFTVVHGSPDHHRGLLPSRCQDGKDDRIEIGHGYGFWQRHVFPPQVTADGGGHGRWTQFWMLCVDQLQHLKMYAIFQVKKRLAEYLPLFFVEFKDGCAGLAAGALEREQVPSNFFRLHLVHGLDPPGLDRLGGLEQIKNTLASL